MYSHVIYTIIHCIPDKLDAVIMLTIVGRYNAGKVNVKQFGDLRISLCNFFTNLKFNYLILLNKI